MFMWGNSHESFDVMFARLTKRCMKLLLPVSQGLIGRSLALFLMRRRTFMNVFKFRHSMHQVNNKCFRVDCKKVPVWFGRELQNVSSICVDTFLHLWVNIRAMRKGQVCFINKMLSSKTLASLKVYIVYYVLTAVTQSFLESAQFNFKLWFIYFE